MGSPSSIIIEALLLGIVNGIYPGTISTILMSETLEKGYKKGLLIAISPVFFGIVIVPFIFVLSEFLKRHPVYIGIISFLGGLYVLKLGIDKFKEKCMKKGKISENVFLKAVLINFANPYGYVFWLAAGIPLVSSASRFGFAFIFFLFITYYAAMITMKAALVGVTHMGGKLLAEQSMRYMNKFFGYVLIGFSCYFFIKAAQFIFL